jgi:hypothetical protein
MKLEILAPEKLCLANTEVELYLSSINNRKAACRTCVQLITGVATFLISSG